MKNVIILFVALLLLGACKKKDNQTTTNNCTSTIYGYTTPVANMYDTISGCMMGVINPSTGAMATYGSFQSSVFTCQGVYNSTTNNYSVFKTSMGGGYSSADLITVGASGSVIHSVSSIGINVMSLAYNRVNHKYYGTKDSTIVEITPSGATLSITVVANIIHPSRHLCRQLLTVDQSTGDMYYATGDASSNWFIEKYVPGASAPTVVASGTATLDIMGLRYNINDRMLYAVRENAGGSTFPDFIQINPASGAVTTLTTLPYIFNSDFNSTCIDPCSNRYIIATLVAGSSSAVNLLEQRSMTGAVIRRDTTATLYMGMDVMY